jgi:hypothetical protein
MPQLNSLLESPGACFSEMTEVFCVHKVTNFVNSVSWMTLRHLGPVRSFGNLLEPSQVNRLNMCYFCSTKARVHSALNYILPMPTNSAPTVLF